MPAGASSRLKVQLGFNARLSTTKAVNLWILNWNSSPVHQCVFFWTSQKSVPPWKPPPFWYVWAPFKLAFEESDLLVLGNQLLVTCRAIPEQPKQEKGILCQRSCKSHFLAWYFSGTLRSDASVDESVERNSDWRPLGKGRCVCVCGGGGWWNGVLETGWARGALDRELTNLHGVVVKRRHEATWVKRHLYFRTKGSCLHARLH